MIASILLLKTNKVFCRGNGAGKKKIQHGRRRRESRPIKPAFDG